MPRVVLIGAGDHARVLVDTLEGTAACQLYAVLDKDDAHAGSTLQGLPILPESSTLNNLREQGVSHFVVAVAGPRQASLRRQLFQQALQAGLQPWTVTHSTACISTRARLGAGVQLLARCVVNTGARLQSNVIVNTGAIVEHDCHIGPHAHIAPGVCLAGGVRVGTGAHIGVGAVVKEYVSIGDQALVGAGAVVIHDVPAQAVVAGIPAKPLRIRGAA